ncbi:diaminopimelate epimerase [Acidothermus cellulolyticus 11B]|uniref:Diaminopimelate epimerase n=1 Tax=Acidothermus cellulolyticus (strain ATCC 43068 / DSM 8971 / 11B) TaxID=351607 RepID=DAPF_ACIC1|nr:diaminopimelate epimerase [Acidothermus cellulolyticus]A0LUZ5.1 RecName: Full=Diaminopimelate epimerase; Short=DAP epimerase; AltName: Full=PLP-independent amino acid racemase [Acidothermus cellulolyticus 11B]ABK53255.1 diaminopimelate epimerase [Acidothermus cellulolyticus 11B]
MDDVPFLKGHATRNDFVILPDHDDELELDAALVRAICDRRRGLGADGILRVVAVPADDAPVSSAGATADAAAGRPPQPSAGRPPQPAAARWFMDYRNADGSVAEICGNGIRLFARYLVDAGLEEAGRFLVGTRIGPVPVDVPPAGDVTAWLPAPELRGGGRARFDGRMLEGVRVSVGNPHLVCVVDTLADVDFTRAPVLDSDEFPDGANVEVVEIERPGVLRMRVYERGVGETWSCGSGACAVAAVAEGAERIPRPADGWWRIVVPGGELRIRFDGDRVALAGPAVVVAEGRLHLAALEKSDG